VRKTLIAVLILSAFCSPSLADSVPTVDANRHTGGFASWKNNQIFAPAGNVTPLPNKNNLSRTDKNIISQAETLINSNKTTSLILVEKGQIVFEKYKAPANQQSPLFSQSMSKSLTALTIGNMLCDGKINSLDDPAEKYVPAIKGTVQGESSLRHLLTMSAGNKDAVMAGSNSNHEWIDIVQGRTTNLEMILNNGERDTTWRGPLAGGKEFRYVSTNTVALSMVADAAGGFFNSFEKYVWQPAGTESKGYWFYDKEKKAVSNSGVSATGRDWARLAMYSIDQLKNGNSCMKQFMQEATSPQISNTSKRIGRAFNSYGYQTWIADFRGKKSYWWVGYGGQRIGVDPETERIIVLTSWKEDYMSDVYKLFIDWQSN